MVPGDYTARLTATFLGWLIVIIPRWFIVTVPQRVIVTFLIRISATTAKRLPGEVPWRVLDTPHLECHYTTLT